MKNILIVTYVFPPYVAVGGYRIIKFCKYLPLFGYNPIILTPEKPNTRAYDRNMLKQIDSSIRVYRTATLEPFRQQATGQKTAPSGNSDSNNPASPQASSFSLLKKIKRNIKQNLSVPDSSFFWAWFGLKQGVQAVKKEKIDIILSSSPPQSVHMLANRIANMTSLPNVLDFRDLWTQNTSYAEKNLPPYLLKRDRKYELKVLKDCSGIIANTDTFRNQLLEKNSFLDNEIVRTVTNGVDPDDFTKYVSERPKNEKFTMLYSGSLYGQHRNPDFFLAAIQQWIKEDLSVKEKLQIEFIGNKTPEYDNMVNKFGLSGIVKGTEWMPQEKLFEKLIASDLLLLFQGFDSVLNSAIPRKLFEYMITNKDILAFAPDGEIPGLIEQYKCGECFSSKEPQPIISYLKQAFKKWENSEKQPSTLRSMPDLETKSQVKILADLCDRLL